MDTMSRIRVLARRGAVLLATAALAAIAPLAATTASAATGGTGTGTAGTSGTSGPTGGAAPTPTKKPKPHKKQPGRWISGVTITEYWPAPESWFAGKLVTAPGLPGKHRIDWLYSAEGISMQGEGVGLDGRMYHIQTLGTAPWVTAAGKVTKASNEWRAGAPYWRDGNFWHNSTGAVTFPLQAGGWSAGRGRKYVPLKGVTFAPGASLPLTYFQSIAVDPKLIPIGSRVYIPAYKDDGHGGWFTAQDTGGAIDGRRIDVFRPPPPSATDGGQYLTSQRVLVVKPKQ
jgi:3D (Asp-Asp-Asp) domain-containing protein